MDTVPEHMDELIAGYLAGEASPEEAAAVERWKNENEANQKYFDHMALIFGKAAELRETIPFDTDKAWITVRERLKTRGKTVPLTPPQPGFSFLRIAAGIAIFIAAGVIAYRFLSADSVQYAEVMAGDETASDTLPDGTAVFLNRGTMVQYAFDKRTETHTAKLQGEAYFTIHHDDTKTFIVEAGETLIKDIGTAFNVRAYPDSNTVEVVVEEGVVLFYTKSNPGVEVKASGRAIYNTVTREFVLGQPDMNTTAYKTRSFTFSNDSLGTVVETLNRVYARKLRIPGNLSACRLTVTFNEERIEEIAQVIAETLGLTVSEEADAIWLRGQGCGEAPMP